MHWDLFRVQYVFCFLSSSSLLFAVGPLSRFLGKFSQLGYTSRKKTESILDCSHYVMDPDLRILEVSKRCTYTGKGYVAGIAISMSCRCSIDPFVFLC